jgi:uncharacterized protein
MAEVDVVDNTERHRFEINEDGHRAELVYEVRGNELVLVHTGVPEALGGRGLGGVLVAAALDRAAAEDLTVVPQCPFARSWLEKHPDEAARANIKWPPAPED